MDKRQQWHFWYWMVALAGRAVAEFRGARIRVEDIATEAVGGWLRENLNDFDAARGLRLTCMTKPGSPDLVDLFLRQHETGAPLANDTSVGVGYTPLSELERVVLAAEQHLNGPAFKQARPETGEDIKVIGVRQGGGIKLILSCTFTGRRLSGLAAYRHAREALADEAARTAQSLTIREVSARVNRGDDIDRGSVYLTIGGTSAECGDDGEVGGGNRSNGLITPFRPMTIDAMAGKNPITHVGKLYSAAAIRLARRAVDEQPEIRICECVLVNEMGRPVHQPLFARPAIGTEDGGLPSGVRDIAEVEIASIVGLWRDFLTDGVC